MARIDEDLQKIAIPGRTPQDMRMQGEYAQEGERLDGQPPGLAAGIVYARPEDRPLRGPYEFMCRHENALCYDVPLQSFKSDMAVLAYMQELYVPPTTLRQIAMGWGNAYALLTDGTVLVAGNGYDARGQHDCTEWTGVQAIDAGTLYVAGSTGSQVLLAGDHPCGAPDSLAWEDVAFLHCSHGVYGVTSGGLVLFDQNGGDSYGKGAAAAGWGGITKVDTGERHVVGLRSDGTVVGGGTDGWNALADIGSWTDIVDIAAGRYVTVGLKSDGTCVVTGTFTWWPYNGVVESWTDVQAIHMHHNTLAAVKNDGTIVAAGTGTTTCSHELYSDWENILEVVTYGASIFGRTSCKAYVCVNGPDYGTVSDVASGIFNYCL